MSQLGGFGHVLPADNSTTPGNALVIIAERAAGTSRRRPRRRSRRSAAAVLHRHGLAVADVRFLPRPRAIPRTTSGKLARQACRAQYLGGVSGHALAPEMTLVCRRLSAFTATAVAHETCVTPRDRARQVADPRRPAFEPEGAIREAAVNLAAPH